jgi:hypothetical protein
VRDAVIAKMDELKTRFPPGLTYRSDYDTTVFVRDSIQFGRANPDGSDPARRARRDFVPADLACVDHSADRRTGLGGRHLRRAVPARASPSIR